MSRLQATARLLEHLARLLEDDTPVKPQAFSWRSGTYYVTYEKSAWQISANGHAEPVLPEQLPEGLTEIKFEELPPKALPVARKLVSQALQLSIPPHYPGRDRGPGTAVPPYYGGGMHDDVPSFLDPGMFTHTL